ncbi:hypothetical protein ACVR0S_02145 [Streptococcus dentapri]|uniref:Uncharacterized protein n=1 Tax=Streptococcus dentapri TaxID=573564 RepID=A0ABV8CYQ9_9STRE
MKKQEWLELFASVNGRWPSPEELKAAMDQGVVTDAAEVTNGVADREEIRTKIEKIANQNVKEEPKEPIFHREMAMEKNQKQEVVSSESEQELSAAAQSQSVADSEKTIEKAGETASQPAASHRSSFGGVHEVHQAPSQLAVASQEVEQSDMTSPSSQGYTFSSQSESVSLSKKQARWPKVLGGLVAFLLLLLAGAGGYAWWRYDSGKIEGAWQLTQWSYYNQKDREWVDVLKRYKDRDYTYSDFVTIDENRNFQEDSYFYANDYKNYPYLSLGSYLDDVYQVNQWDKNIKIGQSSQSYERQVTKILKNDLKGYYNSVKTADVNDDIDGIVANYDYSRDYTVKGNRLTIITKDQNGKVISKAVYQRLSDSKARKLKKTFNNVKKKFEDNYNID